MFVLDAEVEVHVARPPEAIFPYLSNGENFPAWSREFQRMDKLTEGPVGQGTTFRFAMRAGREPVVGTVEWVAFEPPRRFSWQGSTVQRKPGTVTPRGTFHLEPAAGGTRVRVVFEPELRGLPRLVRPLLTWFVKRTWTKDLRRLKGILEAP